jgi:hypothetical protein
MTDNIHYTRALRLHQTVQNADVEIVAMGAESDVISDHTFPQIDVSVCL